MSLSEDIISYLQPNENEYKKKNIIVTFLNQKLSPYYFFEYDLLEDIFKKNYSNNPLKQNITENRVLVFFINYNTCLAMPISKAETIPCVKNVIAKDFKEKPIKFKYYDKDLDLVLNSPIIIILRLPLESIIINDKTLFENLTY